MKTLIAGLLIAASSVAAAQVMVSPNADGGEIVLTGRPCPTDKTFYYGYAFAKGGKAADFCWIDIDNEIHAYYYPNGEKYIYRANAFKLRAAKSKGGAV